MSTRRLSELVTVRGRFHRSVSLSRDWAGARDFSEYIVTPAIRSIAEQMLAELRRPQGVRSWSLTGPYGTGKSAFSLFLADVVASRKPAHDEGRSLRTEFLQKQRPLLPILLQAERGPLLPSLLNVIATELSKISRPLAARARKLADERNASGEAVAQLLLDAAQHVAKGEWGGIALFVDEFGKYLEYAAAEKGDEDVYILQQLAEAAARSPAPILFVTVLHTGFSDYVHGGDEIRRAEWQKVQGRFRDIPFQLPTEQLLSLVAHALEAKLSNGIGRAYEHRAAAILESKPLKEALARGNLRDLMPRCLPLNPVAALVLWPLFRSKIAQNERSLFAFLTSHEPHGFQEFLLSREASSSQTPLYGLPELYDYVVASLGLAAFSGTDSRRWALIDQALHRVPASAPPAARDLVKAIGLLNQYGTPVGLHATEQTLRVALDDQRDLTEALDSLQRESIALYRRHTDSFGLWEGSDLDLDAAFAEARTRISKAPLHERLERSLDLRPVVARAHYVQKGTLRFFDLQVIDSDPVSLEHALSKGSQADGRIFFVIGQGAMPTDPALEFSRLIPTTEFAVVAAPRVAPAIADAVDEYEAWQWVRDHVSELAGDPVARQEVKARVEGARIRLEQIAGPALGVGGHALDPSRSQWFYRGKPLHPYTPREFQAELSGLCREIFQSAPPLRNELLNRHNLSSAAAKARRNLLERMVQNQHQERLGIEGFPPEYSMYAAMLEEGGFHGGKQRRFRLSSPQNPEWKPAWDAVEKFLAAARDTRRPIQDLFRELKAPPFGMRDGPIPVLFVAALLVHGHEVALYEDALFVPEVSIEVIERLLRRPETFEVQSYRLSRPEKQILAALTAIMQSNTDDGGDAFLSLVKALVRQAASLTPYAKQTRRMDASAVAVRDILLSARDPKALVFEQLPKALNVKLGGAGAAARMAKALGRAVEQLSRAYPSLLEHVETCLRKAFAISCSGRSAHTDLTRRARPLVPYATEPRLQVFVREAAREDDRDWREVLGRAVFDGKPTTHWRDEDASTFLVRAQALAHEFERLEELVAVVGDGASTVLSIGVLEHGSAERRTVISTSPEIDHHAQALATRVKEFLGATKPTEPNRRTVITALAAILREIATQPEEQEHD